MPIPPSRRAINEKAWTEMYVEGDVRPFSPREMKRICRQLPFLKADKDAMPYSRDRSSVKPPRTIQAHTSMVAIILGLVFHLVEAACEALFKYPHSPIVYACGVSPHSLNVSFDTVVTGVVSILTTISAGVMQRNTKVFVSCL